MEPKHWGWKEGWGGRPPLALFCAGSVGGEWRTEHFPLFSPDSPGAWKVGVSLGGGKGGCAQAQELSYFCNTEHICSQPQRRSNSGHRAGMQGARQRQRQWWWWWGAAISPLLADWRAPVMPFREGGATHSKVHGVGRDWALVVMVMV